MKASIAKIVGEFRKDMAERHSTFFIVYTDVDKTTGAVLTKVTSNSTQEGISAILSLLLEPTEEAVKVTMDALDADKGFFSTRPKRMERARELLERLTKLYKAKGFDIKPVEPPARIIS